LGRWGIEQNAQWILYDFNSFYRVRTSLLSLIRKKLAAPRIAVAACRRLENTISPDHIKRYGSRDVGYKPTSETWA
jgi:hypothetical protein